SGRASSSAVRSSLTGGQTMRMTGWRIPLLAIVSFGVGAAVAKGGAAKELVVVPAGEVKMAPMMAGNPLQFGVATGDPKTGPVATFLRNEKGNPGPEHWHSSDYYCVVLHGTVKHYMAGKQADAKELKEGAFWYQPGGSDKTAHVDQCVGPDYCLYFLVWTGKVDNQM